MMIFYLLQVKVLLTAMMAFTGFVSAAQDTAPEQINSQEGADPNLVHFGIYILDIDDISGQNQSFTINAFTFLQWKDERLAHSETSPLTMPLDDVWNPRILLVNRQARLRMMLPEVVSVESDGTVTYRQQFAGPLSQPLILDDFPVDTQVFSIQFAAAGFRLGELEFVPYDWELEIPGGGISESLSLPDWEILGYSAEARPYMLTEDIGAPGFALEFVARRYFTYYLWHGILPLLLIVLISWAPFWVNPTKAGLQTSLASSAVLTFIAYRFLLANMLPKLPYLTRLDYLTLGGTILVFGSFVEVLVTTLLAQNDKESVALKVDLWCRVVFPVAFAAILVWTLFA